VNPAHSPSRIAAAAEMTARDLGRRRLALVLIIALPLVFYFLTKASEGGTNLTAGGIGVSWAIGAAALFASLDARAVDERLVLDGYRPRELFVGRLVFLLVAGGVLAAAVGGLMLAVSRPPDHVDLFLAMALVALTAVPLGLAVGALVPHELEGILLLIGLIGIQIGLPSSSTIVGVLPLGNAQRLLDRSAHGTFTRGPAVAGCVGWAVLLSLVAVVALQARLEAHRHRTGTPRWRSAVPIALAATASVALIIVPLAGSSGADDTDLGLQAFQAVVNQWGVCLEFAGVPLGDATATQAVQAGTPGMVVVLPRGATFFVPTGRSVLIATPDNATTRRLIARGKSVRPICSSQER
jgi:hypothetical protein